MYTMAVMGFLSPQAQIPIFRNIVKLPTMVTIKTVIGTATIYLEIAMKFVSTTFIITEEMDTRIEH